MATTENGKDPDNVIHKEYKKKLKDLANFISVHPQVMKEGDYNRIDSKTSTKESTNATTTYTDSIRASNDHLDSDEHSTNLGLGVL